ncbi:antitoxin ParD1/3/4 [Xaviernesmea oryzae]|nr:antitoxin ParD1/3/4 [Xaviernesmea oryzae]
MSPQRSITITLSDELDMFLDEEVRRGVSRSRTEYLQDLLQERYLGSLGETERKELKRAIRQGLDDAEAGRLIPLDEAFARLKAHLSLPSSKQQ